MDPARKRPAKGTGAVSRESADEAKTALLERSDSVARTTYPVAPIRSPGDAILGGSTQADVPRPHQLDIAVGAQTQRAVGIDAVEAAADGLIRPVVDGEARSNRVSSG